jgi:hypothetical protein
MIRSFGINIYNRGPAAISVIAILLLVPMLAWAQTDTAAVVGTVTDPSGAVLPNATVTITNVATGAKRTTQTSSVGDYILPLLQVGTYKVTIEATGFKTFVASDLPLAAGTRARLDAKLEIGTVSETVEVEAASAAALHTENATIGTLLSQQAVQDLPLDGRNLFSLVQLSVGVTAGSSDSLAAGNRSEDRRNTSAFSVNGQSDTANNSMVDGMDNNSKSLSQFTVVRPSVEGIQEMNIQTSLYSAEVGRTVGGVVDVITKSGTNSYHGSLYEYVRNNAFDARNYFDTAPEPAKLIRNQFGGSIGGPIVKDKTFFFFDLEDSREIRGFTGTATVPTQWEHDHIGDFSDIPGGQVISASQIDPIGKAYFQMYPAPNVSGQGYNWVSNPNYRSNYYSWDLRIDHNLSDKDSFFVRYSFNQMRSTMAGPFPLVSIQTANGAQMIDPGGNGPSMGNGANKNNSRWQAFAIRYTRIARPNLLFDFRLGYNRGMLGLVPLNDQIDATALGFPCNDISCVNINVMPYGLPQVSPSGYASLGDNDYQKTVSNTFQYAWNMTWNKGSQGIKAGVGVIRRQSNDGSIIRPIGGTFSFGGIYGITGNGLADMLLGKAASIGVGGPTGISLVQTAARYWELSSYLQDDWRVNRWLTLNLGVRYDVYPPGVDKYNYLSGFDLEKMKIVSPMLLGDQSSSRTLDIETNWKMVAPRFGFAASLGHGTVLRGGFGLAYSAGGGVSRGAPFQYYKNCGTLKNPQTSADCGSYFMTSDGYVNLSAGLPRPEFNLSLATDPNIYLGKDSNLGARERNPKPSYLEQYSLQVEKEFWGNVAQVGYLGNLGRHLNMRINLNQTIGGMAPFPLLSSGATVNYSNGMASTSYNALQTSFLRRFKGGMTATVNYTWSHSIGNTGTWGNGMGGGRGSCIRPGCLVDNVSNPSQPFVSKGWQEYDWGNTDSDIRHRLTGMIAYQLPWGKGSSTLASNLVKGWSVNAILTMQTGTPFTVTNQTSVSGVRAGGMGLMGAERPNYTGSGRLDNPTLAKWFDYTAFRRQTAGTLGNEGLNQLTGPGRKRLDFAIAREFVVHEDLRLQFRAEAFNLTNTPTFANPGNSVACYDASSGVATTLTTCGGTGGPGGPGGPPPGGGGPPPGGGGTLGAITSTVPGMYNRELQFALKLVF